MSRVIVTHGAGMDTWTKVGAVADIPKLGARVVKAAGGDIAVFRNAEDEVFALRDKCPHRGGPLSQGIVFGRSVACPLHNWVIGLEDGQASPPDTGCAGHFAVRVADGIVYLKIRRQDASAGDCANGHANRGD